MKRVKFAFPIFFFLIACGGEESTSNNDSTTFEADEAEQTEEEHLEEINQASEELFLAYVGVDRYEDPEAHDFSFQSYNDLFYYHFPHPAEFKELEKTDHTAYFASEVIEGSQYIIQVHDYTESVDAIEIDAGFTKWMQDQIVNMYSSEIVHERELIHLEDVAAYYTVYKYTIEDVEYTVDCAHFGFDEYIVQLTVIGTPYAESYSIITDFIGVFQLIEPI